MIHENPGDIFSLGAVALLLRDACQEAGGIRAWSRANGVSAALVSRVISRHRKPGPKLLMALNLRESTVYVPTRWQQPAAPAPSHQQKGVE